MASMSGSFPQVFDLAFFSDVEAWTCKSTDSGEPLLGGSVGHSLASGNFKDRGWKAASTQTAKKGAHQERLGNSFAERAYRLVSSRVR
jgi:hypothetical protein